MSARKELIGLGFTVHVDRSGTGLKWLCLATIRIYPRFTELNEFRGNPWLCQKIFSELAAKYGGEYDGWETQVLNDE